MHEHHQHEHKRHREERRWQVVDAGGVGNKLITYSLQIERLEQIEFVGKK